MLPKWCVNSHAPTDSHEPTCTSCRHGKNLPTRNSLVHSANIVKEQAVTDVVSSVPCAETDLVSKPLANLLKSESGKQKR